jgi:hypothetical protein
MTAPDYQRVLYEAAREFERLVEPDIVSYLSEEVGRVFQLNVEVRLDLLVEKWPEAMIALAERALQQGTRRTFRVLALPRQNVMYAGTAGAVRLIVAYFQPTVRFDVAGISYPA